jgi:hypothetical protein
MENHYQKQIPHKTDPREGGQKTQKLTFLVGVNESQTKIP